MEVLVLDEALFVFTGKLFFLNFTITTITFIIDKRCNL